MYQESGLNLGHVSKALLIFAKRALHPSPFPSSVPGEQPGVVTELCSYAELWVPQQRQTR